MNENDFYYLGIIDALHHVLDELNKNPEENKLAKEAVTRFYVDMNIRRSDKFREWLRGENDE